MKSKLQFHSEQQGGSFICVCCCDFLLFGHRLRVTSYRFRSFWGEKIEEKKLTASFFLPLNLVTNWLEDNLNAEQWQQESTPFSGEAGASEPNTKQTRAAITREGGSSTESIITDSVLSAKSK